MPCGTVTAGRYWTVGYVPRWLARWMLSTVRVPAHDMRSMAGMRHRLRHRHGGQEGAQLAHLARPREQSEGAPHRDKICTSNARSPSGTPNRVGARAGGPRARRAGVGLPQRNQNGEACGGHHQRAREASQPVAHPHSPTPSLTSQPVRCPAQGAEESSCSCARSITSHHPPTPGPMLRLGGTIRVHGHGRICSIDSACGGG